jgi:hypothetical protein
MESACIASGAVKPDMIRPCDTECVVSTESLLKRNLPLIVGLGSGVLVAIGRGRGLGAWVAPCS